MKIGVLGDIHSNFAALQACLEYMEKAHIGSIAFLGDYISDCPSPQKTLSLLKQASTAFQTEFIRGNREEYMINQKDCPNPDWQYGSAWGSLFHTFNRLTEEDIQWFRTLPIYRRVSPTIGQPYEMCHGTPTVARKIVYPQSEESKILSEQMTTPLLLCAHSHVQFMENFQNGVILNCGSVGIPCDNDPCARMAVLTETRDGWDAELVRIPYDISPLEQEFMESGFMEEAVVWAKIMLETVRTGREYSWKCINVVNQLCKETGASRNEEWLWQTAARQVGIL